MLLEMIDGKLVATIEHDLMTIWFVATGILLKLGIQPLGYGLQLDKLGSFFGILGAILISINIPTSKYGFLLLTCSAILWIIVSWRDKLYSLLWMNIVFLLTDIVGIYRWVLV